MLTHEHSPGRKSHIYGSLKYWNSWVKSRSHDLGIHVLFERKKLALTVMTLNLAIKQCDLVYIFLYGNLILMVNRQDSRLSITYTHVVCEKGRENCVLYPRVHHFSFKIKWQNFLKVDQLYRLTYNF